MAKYLTYDEFLNEEAKKAEPKKKPTKPRKQKKRSTKEKVKKLDKRLKKVIGKQEDLVTKAKELSGAEDPSDKLQSNLAKIELEKSGAEAKKIMLQRQAEIIKGKIKTAKKKERSTNENMKYLKTYENFLNEVINITDMKKKDPYAMASDKLFKHMLTGKKRIMFLVKSGYPYIDNSEDMEVLQMAKDKGFGVIEMDQDPAPGKAYVIYNKKPGAKKMAERLAEIAKKHDGYLADKTAEEAREIGELLDYNKEDIDWYVNKNYGE